ncbi:NAD(P)-dependent oxidoreductase [Bacillus sp. CECT 9360]|uniref:NAD-dependent epimerase/dehydratase family protein n=1 Tax=Bacillus sp. CECT 9360 TaxID=2845821 RepID=UPI001E48D02C|nr:NAD(P)-dependent oxidoreductase [Bacillus sp. CECT 9360]CAH0346266.1 dTDP-glucose 4,6-dehydratase [Bacillus sp. CECT 9360]
MTVLITGGSGFVGINIIERLLDENIHVVNYATLPVPKEAMDSLQGRKGNYHYVKGNILDTKLLDSTNEKYDIKTIIHAAAITPDLERERNSSRTITNVNYMGTVEVLESAHRHGIEKFIYISSCTVYGETGFKDEVLSESESIPLPRTLYEITKFAGERTALRYKTLFGMPVCVVRLGYVFGPWEYYTGIRQTLSVPFQVTRNALLNEEALLPRPGLRDWVYSKDVANSIFELLRSQELTYDLYNIGSGQTWSVEDWCQLLQKQFLDFKYKVVGNFEEANIDFFDPEDIHELSVERLKSNVGYNPKYGIEESFQDYMDWIKQIPLFWTDPVRNKMKATNFT